MIYHGDTEGTEMKLIAEEITDKVIGAAIEVQRVLGPGLRESAYEECRCHDLKLRSFS